LSDSPHFLRAIGEFFHLKLGYDVYLPLLQGHGLKKPDGMDGVSLQTWKKNVEFAIDTAAISEKSLSIGGLSTGGALSFYMGATHPAITGDLYLFSAALGLYDGRLGIIGRVLEFLLRTPFTRLTGNTKMQLIGPNPYRYASVSINSAKELSRLIREINGLIHSFKLNRNFKKRIFSVSSEYDNVISLRAINRLRQITEKDDFVQYSIRKSLKVDHACVVLKDPIYTAGARLGEPPLEKANPEFPQIMADLREFQNYY
jgi:esterase/lipase